MLDEQFLSPKRVKFLAVVQSIFTTLQKTTSQKTIRQKIKNNMNQVNPKALMHSKWTKVQVNNKEKHFIVTLVTFDEKQKVVECTIEAVISKNEYAINWRELKKSEQWRIGWQ